MRLSVAVSIVTNDDMNDEPTDEYAATQMAASLGQRMDSNDFDNGQYEQIQMQHQQHQHPYRHRRRQDHQQHHHHSRAFMDELRPHHHATRRSSRSTLTSLESGDLLTGGNGNEGSVSSRATATTTCLSANRKASGSASGSSGLSRHRTRRRWPEVAILGRALFVTSVVFFVVGILVTVFGFGGGGGEIGDVEAATETDGIVLSMTSPVAGARTSRQALPMQIIGPALLVATFVVWLAGFVFWRIWSTESKRRQRAIELRTRVQLHSIAMDLLKHSLGSRLDCADLLSETHAGVHRYSDRARLSPRLTAELQDPRIRRLLLRELRHERALDLTSSPENSRRSSLAASFQSKRRRCSSTVSAMLRHGAASMTPRGQHRLSVDVTSGKSSRASHRGRFPCKLPGIEISRIDTMDFDNGSSRFSSMTDGLRLDSLVTSCGGRRQFIVIHSDGSSDVSRLSFPSEYSLSATSRSRSSRASSNVSSRLWDFSSPRESDWDFAGNASASNAGVGSSSVTSRPDLRSVRDYSLLSPAMPRKGSSVTFDIGEPTVRRHSSPAPSLRFRKDSVVEADRYGNNIRSSCVTGETESLTNNKKSTVASPCAGVMTERGGTGNGNMTSPSQRVHQPLEKRGSSSRGGRPTADQKRDSPLSVVMTTAIQHDDSTTGNPGGRVGSAWNVDSVSRKRSSVSSLKASVMGDASRTAKAKILYGSSGCGVLRTTPTLRRSTTADVRNSKLHNSNDDSGVQTTVDDLDRPRSASLRAEAGTQTPPPVNKTGGSREQHDHRHVVSSFSSNILSPLRSSCFAELSASDNEDTNSN